MVKKKKMMIEGPSEMKPEDRMHSDAKFMARSMVENHPVVKKTVDHVTRRIMEAAKDVDMEKMMAEGKKKKK